MPEAEGDAREQQPDTDATEIVPEPMQQEDTLQLFSQPAGDDDNEEKREQPGLGSEQTLERVLFDVVQLRGDRGG